MNPVTIVLLVILVVLIGAAIGLYFWGKKAQKKQEEQQAQIEAAKQTVSMLVIDKKRLPLKESGLPQMVIDQAPKLMRRTKLPIVKAKIGPKISILIADEKVFEVIPVKKEVKADVSGLYIVGVRGIRGHLETPQKKKGFFKRISAKSKNKMDAVSAVLKRPASIFHIPSYLYSCFPSSGTEPAPLKKVTAQIPANPPTAP